MTCASHYHCNIIFITVINAQLVFNRTTWLYNAGNATFMRDFNTIREREKSIARHDRASEVEFE